MNTLVLGGTGFVSGGIVLRLLSAGHEVTLLNRGLRPGPEGLENLIADRGSSEQMRHVIGDRSFDAIIDCICFTPGDALAAVNAFADRCSRYVEISTDFVYTASAPIPADERAPTGGMNEYGQAKTEAEELLLTAHGEGRLPVTILRPPHVLGAGCRLGIGTYHLRDPHLLARIESGTPILLLDGGQLLVQPVHREDIGRACLAVLNSPDAAGEVFNCAGPDVVTARHYHDLIADALGAEPVYRSLPSEWFRAAFPDKAPFLRHRTYAMDHLAAVTGYRPETPFSHGIFEALDWLQAHPSDEPFRPAVWEEEIAAKSDDLGRAVLASVQ